MKNQFAGAALVGCALAVGALWLSRAPVAAQAQMAPSQAARSLGVGGRGRFCTVSYLVGADRFRESGTLLQTDENWIVLDVLDLDRKRTGMDADGKQHITYTKTSREAWIVTKLALSVEFDSSVVVRPGD